VGRRYWEVFSQSGNSDSKFYGMSKAKVIKIGIYYGAGVVLVGYLAFNIFFNLHQCAGSGIGYSSYLT